jgi:hypothetical protein
VPLGDPQNGASVDEVFDPTPPLNTPAVPSYAGNGFLPFTFNAVEVFNQGPISITAIKFQQLNAATDVVEAVPSSGTIDGNHVDVIATLHNNTATAQNTDVGFGSPIDNSATVGVTQSGVTMPAGGSLNVDENLDSTVSRGATMALPIRSGRSRSRSPMEPTTPPR